MKVLHPKLPKFIGKIDRNPGRWIIIVIINLILAGIITYGVFSIINWNDLSNHSNQAPSTLKSMIEGSLGDEKSTDTTSIQIKSVVKNFNSLYGVSPCIPSIQFQWQTVIPALKDIQDICEGKFSDSLSVIKSLEQLSGFINLEQSSTRSIKAVIDSTAKSTDYSASAKAWSDLATSFSSKIDANFQPVADKIKISATDIAATYATLSISLTAESKSGLDTALSELQKKYDALGDINTVAITERTKLIDSLTKQYQML